ncbi:MAG TPA: hypothetical protein P5545_06885 [Bacteroidota bacterium]|nr:hypothetical protein [Bacteroidota bacterium]
MRSKLYKLLFIFLFLNLVIKINTYSKEDTLNNRITISIYTGSNLPILTKGFLEQYQNQMGGIKSEFQTYWGFGGTINFQIKENFRVSLNAEYIPNSLQDNFSQDDPNQQGLWRNFYEDMTLTTVPIIITGEYYQFYEKYKSYFGAGIGISYSYFIWKELVNSPLKYDTRKSSTVYNSIDFYPTLYATVGVDLDWDKERPDFFMKSTSISSSFYYVIRYPRIFKNLESQIVPFPDEMMGGKGVAPFYIGINIGLTFNIEKYLIKHH